MNNIYLDTEFDEDGRTIELISVALVHENGREYHAVSTEFDPTHCNEWVQQNVLPHLPTDRALWKPRSVIAAEVREFAFGGEGKPQFWAYFADYDWVALCQLFGRMIDLPKGFPMYCRDLKQRMDSLGVKKEQLPAQAGVLHSALEDARWVREASLWLDAYGAS